MYQKAELGLTIDTDGIAQGMLKLMRQVNPDLEILIRFGMLPGDWMNYAKQSIEDVIRERYQLLPGRDEYTIIAHAGDPDHECEVVNFKLSQVVSEALHEVALSLYGAVDMVV